MATRKKKRSYRQTGTSNKKRDSQRPARRPGKRKSRSTGKTYTERRKNRSDMPGSMTGKRTSYLSLATDADLRRILVKRVEAKRDGLVLKKYKTPKKRMKKKYQKQIVLCNRDLRKLEKPR